MIEIQLDKKWWLTSDPSNWILAIQKTRKNKDTGHEETYLEGQKFFVNLDNCLRYYTNLAVKTTDEMVNSISQLIELLKNTSKAVYERVNGVNSRQNKEDIKL